MTGTLTPPGGLSIQDAGSTTSYVVAGTGTTNDGKTLTPGAAFSAVVLAQASAAQTVASNSGVLDVTPFREIAVDATVTTFTGGTTPTIQFYVDRQGADGVWYRVWTGSALSAAGPSSTSIGLGGPTNASIGSTIRLGWLFTGAPTSITFSASILGTT